MSDTNLTAYYRRVKKFITLPSGNNYYTENVIELSDGGEVGIRSMTSDDELTLKNPDALLNGEAIKKVLLSCVEGLVKPESLLSNDVDVILSSIRMATYKEQNYTVECPKCKKENSFSLDMESLIEGHEKLEAEYKVNVGEDESLEVYVRPFLYSDKIKMLKVLFEQEKIKSQIQTASSPEAALKTMSNSLKEISKLNLELLVSSIYQLYDASEDIDIQVSGKNRQDVYNLLKNLDLEAVQRIEEKVKEINDIGMEKTLTIKCDGCEHEWETSFETNPVNFSLGS